MAESLKMTNSVMSIGGFTLQSIMTLNSLVRGFHTQNKDARALKGELSDLTGVLSSLLETIAGHPNVDFKALEIPLQRCGKACEEYGKIIARFTKHSSDPSRSSVRDWVQQKYLQGDINDFRTMLAAHKSTISIALANANLRISAVPPEVLEEYKDLIADTTSDLNDHLEDLQKKIDRLQAGDSTAVDDVAIEWQAMMEEKESTHRGLNMCAQLSAQIAQFESESSEHMQFSERPSASKYVKTSLTEAKGTIRSLIDRLQKHEAILSSQLEAMCLKDVMSEPVAAQLARLQQTKESVSQCIQIVSEASELVNERSNLFEDITLHDNSYAFSVSTMNELVTARRLNLTGRSRHFGGQVTDETVQQSMAALTNLDLEYMKHLEHTQGRHHDPLATHMKDPNSPEAFHRFGPGNTLSSNKTPDR